MPETADSVADCAGEAFVTDAPQASRILASSTPEDVSRALGARIPDGRDLLAMLSSAAQPRLEEMARLVHRRSLGDFGRAVVLYAPLYASNHCENGCLYCGFRSGGPIRRRALSLEELRSEAAAIAEPGLRHVLLLTGESRKESPPEYIIECVKALRERFSSVSVEIYPLTEEEYRRVVEAGADGLTLYQEVYDRGLYATLHPFGPKRDYDFRFDAPDRAGRAGMRFVNLGILLGLSDWRVEAFMLGLHLRKLQHRHPDVDFGFSLPRMRPASGGMAPTRPVTDAQYVQILLALKLFLPRLGFTLSTRESPELRGSLIPLGVSRMSAGSRTSVGGYSLEGGHGQFEICDDRTVAEVRDAVLAAGYEPVFKDWETLAP